MPPEILGYIFRRNVTPVDDFDGLAKGSYNFVLVCHHWFKVASSTPDLWSFWGNSLEQWSTRYQHRGTAPIDVRLHMYGGLGRGSNVIFDGPLRDALRDRAERDSIRTLHLSNENTDLLLPIPNYHTSNANIDLLHSMLPVLIPSGQGIQHSSIESLILEDFDVDVSDFFTRRHFSKLRRLSLSAGIGISTWAHLESHMTALTTLSLTIGNPGTFPTPTISQLLSIFASNPRLQRLSLSIPPIFEEYGDVSAPQIVNLPYLKSLYFSGDFEPLLRVLHQIDHPEPMDEMRFLFTGCRAADVSGILGPYLRDCIQRDGRFRDGLGICVRSSYRFISVEVATASGIAGPTLSPRCRSPFLVFEVSLVENTGWGPSDKPWVDFVTHTPREHVICLEVSMGPDAVKEIIPTMPNIQELTLINKESYNGSLRPAHGPFAIMKLLPSPRYLRLYDFDVPYWASLVSYLVHQTSGGQVISLRIAGEPVHICPHLVESIRNAVEELVLDESLKEECRLGICYEADESDSDGCVSLSTGSGYDSE